MASNRFDLIVFDWDGTILDSTAAIVSAMQSACRDLGLSEPAAAIARQVIGLGLADALRIAAPDLTEESVPHLVARYRHHYLSGDRSLALFEGVEDMLGDLRTAGYLLAVATGKGRQGLNRALDHSGLGALFVASRCADECFSKPHPQMLEELMAELDVPPERTLMIGDTTHDVQMARNAGVAALAVTYGAHSVVDLSALEPLACLDDVPSVRLWLREHA